MKYTNSKKLQKHGCIFYLKKFSLWATIINGWLYCKTDLEQLFRLIVAIYCPLKILDGKAGCSFRKMAKLDGKGGCSFFEGNLAL